MDTFSDRNNIPIPQSEITIRQDAPLELREWLFSLVVRLGFPMKSFRGIICQMSYQTADPNQWGENEYMASEIQLLLEKCRWHYIYDIIEETFKELPTNKKEDFRLATNRFFTSNGYGWKLESGQIISRGDDVFEEAVGKTITCIESSNPDAYNEIKEALQDISKRPEPDITGAIQHAMAALECFCRKLYRDEKPTFGKLIDEHRCKIQPPLDQAMTSLWGFASERGRHLKEGKGPSFKDAELTVHICASLISYFK